MKTTIINVTNSVGLHARPAALFVSSAKNSQSVIQIRNLSKSSAWGNAKSILSVLTLGIEKDHQIEIKAEGPDEEQAIQSLEALVKSNFGADS